MRTGFGIRDSGLAKPFVCAVPGFCSSESRIPNPESRPPP